ncbi:polysaccharide deacetylase family protein [Pelotalea chapellei]|uniref:Polysaccharide deacetylase family protein n=1 Tax=Pelotalea chapellei TaxID=44671 RepID=A0ABS5U9I4_9BACT|nr:polysaccharide deacetylase family protein [Pelotalea chapellei]MBT1072306.1 polysaccharide deacetylase family protein [Pelotalea chapellei]
MAEKILAFKVDVDTYAGTRDGVPRLLEDMARFGIKATFYFSLGPDNTGKAIRRIFTCKGFLKKLISNNSSRKYNLKTMLYGTLLPAPMIAEAFPDVLCEAKRLGHEMGIHCWDHVKWHDYLPWLPKHLTALELGRAFGLFEEIVGHWATTCAAPGWMVSPDSLEVQDVLRLDYCSDGRGTHPFYPVMAGRRFRTLQIPTTLPTADELLGANGIAPENLDDYYMDNLKEGINVMTIQAELEGGRMRPYFVRMLERVASAGIRCITLGKVAENVMDAPACELFLGEFPGRVGKVAIQGAEVS